MKYAIFLTQKGQINLQNYSKVACLNMGRKNSADTMTNVVHAESKNFQCFREVHLLTYIMTVH